MPNYVFNVLEITGDKKELKRFREENAGEYPDEKGKKHKIALSFDKLIPQPAGFSDNEKPVSKKFSMPRWYIWRLRNWGTKWNCYEIEIKHTARKLIYRFQTAWSPPEAWLAEIAMCYPALKFQMCFEEEGNNYPKGTFKVQNNKFKELKGCRM